MKDTALICLTWCCWMALTHASILNISPSFSFTQPQNYTNVIGSMDLSVQWSFANVDIATTLLSIDLYEYRFSKYIKWMVPARNATSVFVNINLNPPLRTWSIPSNLSTDDKYFLKARLTDSNGAVILEQQSPEFFIMSFSEAVSMG